MTASPAFTVRTALDQARSKGLDRLDTQWLLTDLLGCTRGWLLAHDETLLTPEQQAQWAHGVQRRLAGEPLAYVLGRWPFRGLTLEVGPGVLIPRPETEELVHWALELLAPQAAAGRTAEVLDLGTGSGAIALALAHAHPPLAPWASDVSPAALRQARRNATRLGLPLRLLHGHWWEALTGPVWTEPAGDPGPAQPAPPVAVPTRFDLVTCNPPYVAPGDPHLDALRHEPLSALVAPHQGLAALQEVIDAAPAHLHGGGWLLLEHGHDQSEAVRQRLHAAGLRDVQTRSDLAGLARVSAGRQP